MNLYLPTDATQHSFLAPKNLRAALDGLQYMYFSYWSLLRRQKPSFPSFCFELPWVFKVEELEMSGAVLGYEEMNVQ